MSPFTTESIDGVPDVDKSRIERREAKAQDVGRAEVADHAARDERLHDGVAALVARITHLAAALGVGHRRAQRQALAGAAFTHALHEEIGQRE